MGAGTRAIVVTAYAEGGGLQAIRNQSWHGRLRRECPIRTKGGYRRAVGSQGTTAVTLWGEPWMVLATLLKDEEVGVLIHNLDWDGIFTIVETIEWFNTLVDLTQPHGSVQPEQRGPQAQSARMAAGVGEARKRGKQNLRSPSSELHPIRPSYAIVEGVGGGLDGEGDPIQVRSAARNRSVIMGWTCLCGRVSVRWWRRQGDAGKYRTD